MNPCDETTVVHNYYQHSEIATPRDNLLNQLFMVLNLYVIKSNLTSIVLNAAEKKIATKHSTQLTVLW